MIHRDLRKLTFLLDRSIETGIAEEKSSAFAEDARMGCANARGARCEMRSRGGTRVDELSARAENGQAARRVVASSCPGPVTAPFASRYSRGPSNATRV